MRKLKVGHVGGRLVYADLFKADPRTEVVALCDINPMALEKARESLGLSESQCFQDYDEFLKKADVDIVFIGTPIYLHAEQSIKAMESGRHVLCEVTAAHDVRACRELVHVAKKTGMKYMLAENMCYVHFIREWTEMIKEGRLGRIYYAEGEYIHQIRRLLRDPSSGNLLWRVFRPPIHYISHSLGPLLMMFDDYVTEAMALGTSKYTVPDINADGAIDMQVALFKTRKGIIIKVLRSQVVAREPPFHYYVIYGTKGCIENTNFRMGRERGLIYIEGEDEIAREIDCPISDPNAPEGAKRSGTHGTSEYYLVKDFIDAIESDRKPPINVIKGVDMTIPGLIAHESAVKGGVWLPVPHLE
ncbi:MAG: Gfo/Idh/MocA family oxidoreductase [Candidatus Bathyarchaeia archaeon]